MKKSLLVLLISFCCTIQAYSQNNYHWVKVPGPAGGYIFNFYCDLNGNLFTYNDNHLYFSSDKGDSWHKKDLPRMSDSTFYYQYMNFFATDSEVSITGFHTDFKGHEYHIFSSFNKGESWKTISDTGCLTFSDYVSGKIYLYNYDSLSIMDMKSGNQLSYKIKKFNYPQNMLTIDNDKLILLDEITDKETKIKTRSLFLVDPKKGESKELNFHKGYIGDFCISGNNDIFITTDEGIFKSSDKGNSWNLSYPMKLLPRDIISSSNGLIYSISDSFTVVVNGLKEHVIKNPEKIIYSPDDGQTWKEIETPFFKITKLLTISDGTLFALTENGIARYNASSWKIMDNGIDNIMFQSIAFDDDNNMYAGTIGCGVYFKKAGTTDWQKFYYDTTKYLAYGTIYKNNSGFNKTSDQPTPNTCRQILTDSKNNIIICTDWGLRRSTDNGNTWSIIPSPKQVIDFKEPKLINDISDFKPDNNIDKKQTREKEIKLFKSYYPFYLRNASGVNKIYINSKDEIYALFRGKLYKSDLSNINWKDLSPKADSSIIEDFSIDTDNNIFIIMGYNRIDLREEKSYFSKDDGKEWLQLKDQHKISNGLLYSSKNGRTFIVDNYLSHFNKNTQDWETINDYLNLYQLGFCSTKDDRLLVLQNNKIYLSKGINKPEINFHLDFRIRYLNLISEDNYGNIYALSMNGLFILVKD